MAELKEKDLNTVSGSLARDLDNLVREQQQAERQQQAQPARKPIGPPEHWQRSRPDRQERPAPAHREKGKLSPIAAVGMVVLTGMLVALLIGYIQLGEISGQVAQKKAQVQQLEREHVALVTEYEKTFDLATIKEVAEKEGMSKASAGQVEYVELGGPDKAQVYETGRKSVLERLWQGLDKTWQTVVEYFR